MKKFNELYKLIMESINNKHIVNEWSSPPYTGDIPRPPRLKTPPNEYGNTGHNAKYYDYYVQDEAEDIYIDKYGEERGHNLWQGIIYKGNAMFTACDEILGELRTMEEINNIWWFNHKDLMNAAGDLNEFNSRKPSWIYQWTLWILTQMIDGKKFTHDFISSCIPTFKWFLNKYPLTFGVLLQAAGIEDIENFKLSKKVQAKIDAEATKKAEEERKKEEERKREEERIANEKEAKEKNKELVDKYGDKFGPLWMEYFNSGSPKYYIYNLFDLSVGVDNIINLPAPTNKDEQRIYDIVASSQGEYQPFSGYIGGGYSKYITKGWHFKKGNSADITKCNYHKAVGLAENMNKKITSSDKRAARKAAAEKYGLTFLANIFK